MNDFDLFWELFAPDEQYLNRRAATLRLWDGRTADIQKAMIEDLRSNGAPKGRNPYFYVLDFQVKRKQTLSFQQYYAKYNTTQETDGWKMVKPEKPGDPPVHYEKL